MSFLLNFAFREKKKKENNWHTPPIDQGWAAYSVESSHIASVSALLSLSLGCVFFKLCSCEPVFQRKYTSDITIKIHTISIDVASQDDTEAAGAADVGFRTDVTLL